MYFSRASEKLFFPFRPSDEPCTLKKIVLIVITGLLQTLYVPAQTCTNPGQTPSSAIRICGSTAFAVPDIPACGNLSLPVPCSGGFTNRNPYWFKMNCYVSGTLGFVIAPGNAASDYNWQLFDITGRNDDDVMTDASLFVSCNWSSDPGETGASQDGVNNYECSGPGKPTFSNMPVLAAGHEYMLLVSCFDGLPGGFQLSVEGGNAVIADPVAAAMSLVQQSCDGRTLTLRTTKPVRCNTIAADGSDFSIAGYTINAAVPVSCNAGFTDAVNLILSSPINNGNYQLTMQTGHDGNTVLDLCGREITAGSQLAFTVAAQLPTLMDSVQVKGCSPSSLTLVFKRPIRCSSITPGGNEFSITGPQAVSVSSIITTCNTGNPPSTLTNTITLQLSNPITTPGNYQVHLVTGADGNTLLDECGKETPPALLPLIIKEPVHAGFTYQLTSSCKTDTLSFFHPGGNGTSQWNWSFDNSSSSTLQNPVKLFADTGRHTIRLIVSNGSCNDTSSTTLQLHNRITPGFQLPEAVCPGDMIAVINKSSGPVDGWQWSMGSGISSTAPSPAAWQYPVANSLQTFQVKLIITNNQYHCRDSLVKTIKVLKQCYAMVPTAFTPNGDGLNDLLYPLLASKADNMVFRVYNRMGQLVFLSNSATQKWDGTFNGIRQDTGLFIWMLSYTHHDTGEKIFLRGTTLLIR